MTTAITKRLAALEARVARIDAALAPLEKAHIEAQKKAERAPIENDFRLLLSRFAVESEESAAATRLYNAWNSERARRP